MQEKLDSSPKQKKIEEKNDFQNRLNSIVGQNITVENINIFADSTLDKLISFIQEVIERYKSEYPGDDSTGKELEDKAFSVYNLSDLNSYLIRVQEKVDQLQRIDEIFRGIKYISEVITPPDESDHNIEKGDNPSEEKVLIPRLKLLLYILDNDFKLGTKDTRLTRGIVTNNMVRSESYITAEIKTLKRVVQVCDEQSNASYVFDMDIMEQAKISVDNLNRAGKDEKNKIIKKYDGIGIRLIQKIQWRDEMTELLSFPIEKKERKEKNKYIITEDTTLKLEDLPQVVTSEFNQWRGFLESDGVHWGTIYRISKHMGVSYEIINNYFKNHPELVSKKARDLVGREVTVYPVEQITDDLKSFLSLPKVATEGEWRGFFENDNVRWGTIGAISNYLKSGYYMLSSYIKDHPELESKKVKDRHGREMTAYSLEQIATELKDRLSYPKVQTEGEWDGFFESDNMHWGPIESISKKLELSVTKLRKYLENHPEIQLKKILDRSNHETKAYSLEQARDSLKDFLSLSEVMNEGDWRGFFESEGMHWGTIRAISKRLGLSGTTVVRHLENHPELQFKKIRNLGGVENNAFCLEQVKVGLENLSTLPKVAIEGKWHGFFESEGLHFGPVYRISEHSGIPRGVVRAYIKKHPRLVSKKVRDLQSKEVIAYPLEKIEVELNKFVSIPNVEIGAEWRGFFESNSLHWGPVKRISRHLELSEYKVATFLKDHPELESKKVRDLSGKEVTAYALEQIEAKIKKE